jgi:hypothetical protein
MLNTAPSPAPAIEHCPVRFLGLTVRPWTTGFDFSTKDVIQIENKTLWSVTSSIPGRIRFGILWALVVKKQNTIVFKLKEHWLISFAEWKEHVEPCCQVLCKSCSAQKHLQEDKKNKRQTELEDEKNRRRTEPYVGYLASHQKQAPDRARGWALCVYLASHQKQAPDRARRWAL